MRREIQFHSFSDSKRSGAVAERQRKVVELFQSGKPHLGPPIPDLARRAARDRRVDDPRRERPAACPGVRRISSEPRPGVPALVQAARSRDHGGWRQTTALDNSSWFRSGGRVREPRKRRVDSFEADDARGVTSANTHGSAISSAHTHRLVVDLGAALEVPHRLGAICRSLATSLPTPCGYSLFTIEHRFQVQTPRPLPSDRTEYNRARADQRGGTRLGDGPARPQQRPTFTSSLWRVKIRGAG